MHPTPAVTSPTSNESGTFRKVHGRSDRRSRPTRPFSRHTLVGRRVRNRRAADPLRRYYVDRADGPWMWVVLAIVAMILLDGAFTLHILSRGGTEVNPIMNWVYWRGAGWFMGVKVGTAAIALPFLTVHRYFRAATWGAALLLVAYSGVMLIHAYTLLLIHA